MDRKVALVYEGNKYLVYLNDSLIDTIEDSEDAYESFKQVIKNNCENKIKDVRSWEDVVAVLSEIKDERLVINNEYQSVMFDTMRYFYSTGKVFFMDSTGMYELTGGFSLFSLVVNMVMEKRVRDCNVILSLCRDVIECKANYGITEESILVASAAFNYGTVQYNFLTSKIYKGTSVSKGTFAEYRNYVLERLNA